MIPFASQRGGGQDLASHLLNNYDNEIAEVCEVRGAVADDLHGAFREWEVQADALTQCRKYLYSLSINPDPAQAPLTRGQYMDYIARVEKTLGLGEQPRAVVFHTKYGREHCHVVWSRIDVEERKAVHLAFDHDKLMQVTRGFARDHALRLPAGYEKSRKVGQLKMYELEQYRRSGIPKEERMRQVTEAWRQSDGARALVRALSERGYLLARGDRKRDYVLVDLYGHVSSLPKMVDDKSVRTKEVRALLEKDFPTESLPSVEEAVGLVAKHRELIETGESKEAHASGLASLKMQQSKRRTDFEKKAAEVAKRHQHLREVQRSAHAVQQGDMKARQRQHWSAVRAERHETRPTGLAAFLGRVTGVEAIRAVWHRRQDGQRLDAYRQERKNLRHGQAEERNVLERSLGLTEKDMARQQAGLLRVERRELAAFLRDQLREQRERDRGGSFDMPSLAHLGAAAREEPVVQRPHDLLAAFERAKQREWNDVPDVARAFERAANGTLSDSKSAEGRDSAQPSEPKRNNDPTRQR